mmetsp:Transcript_34911/g.56331  ORF Transcript_34911/g.56331 Transcript_34911/m.56331 type:complete len:167 (-) Transcript_34911:746-1246(-)
MGDIDAKDGTDSDKTHVDKTFAAKMTYELYFHKYKPESFLANLGLTMDDFIYVYHTYCENRDFIFLEDFMLSLHFCWKYPTAHEGASIWKLRSRQAYAKKVWRPILILAEQMDEIKMVTLSCILRDLEKPALCIQTVLTVWYINPSMETQKLTTHSNEGNSLCVMQ